MNPAEIVGRIPFTGLLRELITIGLLELVRARIFTSKESEIQERITEYMEKLSDKFKSDFSGMSSSKIVLNDRSAYFIKSKRLTKWYGESGVPQDYIGLMIYVLENTSKLLKKKKIDFIESLNNISIGREVVLGRKYHDSLAIVPAVIKQAEFYEFQHEFLKPTAGEKPEILLDPIWFAVLAIGFLICFAGYYGGGYYFITREGVEAIFGDAEKTQQVYNAVTNLTATHVKIKPLPYSEELYELRLSYGLAYSKIVIDREAFPLKVYEISLVGNAYTCTRVILIDLTKTIEYLQAYIDNLHTPNQAFFQVKLKNNQYDNPIHALLELAEREIQKPVKGDNSMLLLTFVKDLYRAIHVGSPNLMEETLLRMLRISHSILTTKEKVDPLLRETFKKFMYEPHVSAVINACKGRIYDRSDLNI